MELKCLHDYSTGDFDLAEGETTEGKEYISADKKVQMLADYPDWFTKISSKEASAVEGKADKKGK